MAKDEQRMVRVEVRIIGRVQGVGFRAWTRRIAQERGLVGYVKNEPEGSVLVIARSSKSQLEEFVSCLEGGPEAGLVDRVAVKWSSGVNEFSDFGIRF